MSGFLSKEDYAEPCCPLKMNTSVTPVPVGRIIEKLDFYLAKNDYAAGLRHLEYWIAEAEQGGDDRGRLTLLNELAGLCRKTGNSEKGLKAVNASLETVDALGIAGTVSAGTTCVNAATALKAFGQPEKAARLYEKALPLYEKQLPADDGRLAALYNNMAITLRELGSFSESEELFYKALGIMEKKDGGRLECAMTYLNLADLFADKNGIEASGKEIEDCLVKAETLLLDGKNAQDSYFAFVCEKCAPSFDYYGYFATAKKLKKLSEEIYERA